MATQVDARPIGRDDDCSIFGNIVVDIELIGFDNVMEYHREAFNHIIRISCLELPSQTIQLQLPHRTL